MALVNIQVTYTTNLENSIISIKEIIQLMLKKGEYVCVHIYVYHNAYLWFILWYNETCFPQFLKDIKIKKYHGRTHLF